MRQKTSLFVGLVVLVASTMTGCGGASKPKEKLVPVSGKVTFMDKPEAGIGVIFMPVKSNIQSHGGNAVTGSDGSFTAKNYMNLDGLPPGDYAVTFSWMRTANGSPIDKSKPPIPGVSVVEKIPAKWSDVKKQGRHNLVSIPESGKKDFDFRITDK